MRFLKEFTRFDWDLGNNDKNFIKHNVTNTESEEAFFNLPFISWDDMAHSSQNERRYQALGKTKRNRKLFIVFTLRDNLVRIISVRDMTPKERQQYAKYEKKSKTKRNSSL